MLDQSFLSGVSLEIFSYFCSNYITTLQVALPSSTKYMSCFVTCCLVNPHGLPYSGKPGTRHQTPHQSKRHVFAYARALSCKSDPSGHLGLPQTAPCFGHHRQLAETTDTHVDCIISGPLSLVHRANKKWRCRGVIDSR